jgi:hypothetical protein
MIKEIHLRRTSSTVYHDEMNLLGKIAFGKTQFRIHVIAIIISINPANRKENLRDLKIILLSEMHKYEQKQLVHPRIYNHTN